MYKKTAFATVLTTILLFVSHHAHAEFDQNHGRMIIPIEPSDDDRQMPKLTLHPKAAPLSMANPASVYCAKLNGHVKIVPNQGGYVGLCYLPNGDVVEEWQLFRSHHRY